MKKLISVVFILVLGVSLVAAACGKATPTATATPTPTPTKTATPTPTVTGTPKPTPTLASPSPQPTEVYEWTFIQIAADVYPLFFEFAETVKERTGGQIKISNLAEGEHPLGPEDYWTALRDRIFDGGYTSPGYLLTEEPIMGMMELPAVGVPSVEAHNALWDSLRDVVYDPILEKYNLVHLFHRALTPKMPFTNVLVDSFDDFQGLRLRTPDPMLGAIIEAVGATAVTLAWGETLPAMQRGILDGAPWPIWVGVEYKVFEILKYVTWGNWGATTEGMTVNKDAFDELPSDLQAILLEVGQEYQVLTREKQKMAEADYVVKAINDFGVTIVGVPPSFQEEFRTRVQPIWQEWVDKSGATGQVVLDRILAFSGE